MSVKIYSELEGKGKFKFEDAEREGEFKLIVYIGKDAELYLYKDFRSELTRDILRKFLEGKRIICSLNGELNGGRRIIIDKLILTSGGGIEKGKSKPLTFKVFSPIVISKDKKESKETKIEFLVTNLSFTGCDITVYPDGSQKLDNFTINLDDHEITIRQLENYKEIEEALKRREYPSAITSKIIVEASLDKARKVSETVNNLCNLLSFATGNSVVPVVERHIENSEIVWQRASSMRVDPFKSGNYLIPELPPDELKNFVNETYGKYKKYKESFGLPVIFDYYLLMKSISVIDIECLLGFVLLECLSSHAQEYYEKGDTPVNPSMVKRNIKELKKMLPKDHNLDEKIIERIAREIGYSKPTLQDTIARIMKDFKMEYKGGEDKIFSLRKEFIHRGMYPKDTPNHLEIYYRIVHFIDRLILHVLGYSGSFLNISNGYKQESIKLSE